MLPITIQSATAACITVTVLLFPLHATASDVDDCNSQQGEIGISACNRAIKAGVGKIENLYVNRGVEHLRKGDTDQAIADFTEAIKRDPNLVQAFGNRASAYYKNGDFDHAIADLNRAINLAPTFAVNLFKRGEIYREKKDLDLAIADFTEAIRLDSRFVISFHTRGLTYIDKKDYARAIADFDESIRIDPFLADNYFHRGAAKQLAGDSLGGSADQAKARDYGFVPAEEASGILQTLSVNSRCCGTLNYGITPGKYLIGQYPKFEGLIIGTLSSDGSAKGLWFQPRSDHPCAEPRRDNRAWGRFEFKNVGTSAMTGEWGWCDGPLTRGWAFQ